MFLLVQDSFGAGSRAKGKKNMPENRRKKPQGLQQEEERDRLHVARESGKMWVEECDNSKSATKICRRFVVAR